MRSVGLDGDPKNGLGRAPTLMWKWLRNGCDKAKVGGYGGRERIGSLLRCVRTRTGADGAASWLDAAIDPRSDCVYGEKHIGNNTTSSLEFPSVWTIFPTNQRTGLLSHTDNIHGDSVHGLFPRANRSLRSTARLKLHAFFKIIFIYFKAIKWTFFLP